MRYPVTVLLFIHTNRKTQMTFQAAITADLIAAIVAKCGVSEERAARELRTAKKTAKATGLTVAEVLHTMGMA